MTGATPPPFSSSAASGPRPPGRGPAVCPAADPVAVLVRVHTPNFYRAGVAWDDLTPGWAVFLAGQFLISTSRSWVARMGIRVGRRFERSTAESWYYLSGCTTCSVLTYGDLFQRKIRC